MHQVIASLIERWFNETLLSIPTYSFAGFSAFAIDPSTPSASSSATRAMTSSVTPSTTSEDAEFSGTGSMRLRYLNDQAPEYDAAGDQTGSQRSDTESRFLLDVGVRKGDQLQAGLRVIHSARLGAQNTANGDYSTVSDPSGNLTGLQPTMCCW